MIKRADGQYAGVEAVIDKDLSSALLATSIKADLFVVLTGVDCVSLHFGQARQEPLRQVSCSRMRQYLAQGHFPPGSMGPKVDAALRYLEAGGREAIITDAAHLEAALDGQAGTHIARV